MTYLLPSLNGLRAFEAAARHLSFKRAAHELHVTAGAVGQQVKTLESQLGIQLFTRMPRGLVLTDAGQTYLPALRAAFQTIAAATEKLRPPRVRTVVTLGIHSRCNMSHIMSQAERFRAEHGESVALRICRPAGRHELTTGKVDMVIDHEPVDHGGYRCDRLILSPERGAATLYLVYADGMASCPEVILLRDCLVTRPEDLSALNRRRAATRL
ncbi:MAG TPA: LysR family transcriptional regulator [Alphaproteobacteria bacterium]